MTSHTNSIFNTSSPHSFLLCSQEKIIALKNSLLFFIELQYSKLQVSKFLVITRSMARQRPQEPKSEMNTEFDNPKKKKKKVNGKLVVIKIEECLVPFGEFLNL